jgi:hypothetical protein
MAPAILFYLSSVPVQLGLKKGAGAPRGDVTREDPGNEERKRGTIHHVFILHVQYGFSKVILIKPDSPL